MKKKLAILALALIGLTSINAKDIQTIVFNPSPKLVCSNCEARIKSNLRFTKGVKDIITNIKENTVLIKYDADKITKEKIMKDFNKIDYMVKECSISQKEK